MKKISHGGNIYKKAKEMGIREEDILGFFRKYQPAWLAGTYSQGNDRSD